MFVRRLKNRSGSVSVQIIEKNRGRYRVVRTVGTSKIPDEIDRFVMLAQYELGPPPTQVRLFPMLSLETIAVEKFLERLANANIRLIGPERIFGTIFDRIGFGEIKEPLFRHLVVTQLAYPGSKLKTTRYLFRYRGERKSASAIYRFLDTLQSTYKETVEKIAFNHTKKRLGAVSVAFYDMTTLYFEAESEDDLRKIGWSKDGKFECPQIMLGLLLGTDGFPIGYDFFEGNTWEGNTLLPVLKKFSKRYGIKKLTVVADAGLLSKGNIEKLVGEKYTFILGARIKNETDMMKKEILEKAKEMKEEESFVVEKKDGTRLIVTLSEKRRRKDARNREKGLEKLRKKVHYGKLTKEHINNRGYNKFLSLRGEVSVTVDEERAKDDSVWDGLKGYVTNTALPPKEIVEQYGNLWRIERAFRISKTDLKIRPVFHRLRKRIEAHLIIAFAAYAVAVELEQTLKEAGSAITLAKAAELTHTMYEIVCSIPGKHGLAIRTLSMDEEQQELDDAVRKNTR